VAAVLNHWVTCHSGAAAFYPVGSTPEAFRVFVSAKHRRHAQNLRDAKVSPQ
jgi:hypothetical protein